MLEGLVHHDHLLTLRTVLQRMQTVSGARTVVTQRDDGEETVATYAEVSARADRLAHAFAEFDIGSWSGDAVRP